MRVATSEHKTQFLSRKFSIFFVSRCELMRGVLQCSSVTFPQQWIVLFGSMMAPFGALWLTALDSAPANCSTVKVAHFKETFCRICLRDAMQWLDIMYNKHLIAPPQYNIYCQYIYIYIFQFSALHCVCRFSLPSCSGEPSWENVYESASSCVASS